MLTSLEVKNYRGFKQFRMDGLTRVNLLVGKNNCGKTALLEVAELVAAMPDTGVFYRIAERRGEIKVVSALSQGQLAADILQLVHGRDPKGVAELTASLEGDANEVKIQISESKQVELAKNGVLASHGAISDASIDTTRHSSQGAGSYFPAWDKLNPGLLVGWYRLWTNSNDFPERREPHDFPIPQTSFTRQPIGDVPHFGPWDWQGVRSPLHSFVHRFVKSDLLGHTFLANMWNQVTERRIEEQVIQALQILDDSIVDIRCLTTQRLPNWLTELQLTNPPIVVARNGEASRVPLGSLGEGMRRMLGLACSLVTCQRGVLLVDEIDSGLHWSTIVDMWRMVAQTARELDVQIFATTHSLDCIRGLAEMYASDEELGTDVSIHKIDPTLEHSVCFEGEDLPVLAEHGIEVRG